MSDFFFYSLLTFWSLQSCIHMSFVPFEPRVATSYSLNQICKPCRQKGEYIRPLLQFFHFFSSLHCCIVILITKCSCIRYLVMNSVQIGHSNSFAILYSMSSPWPTEQPIRLITSSIFTFQIHKLSIYEPSIAFVFNLLIVSEKFREK